MRSLNNNMSRGVILVLPICLLPSPSIIHKGLKCSVKSIDNKLLEEIYSEIIASDVDIEVICGNTNFSGKVTVNYSSSLSFNVYFAGSTSSNCTLGDKIYLSNTIPSTFNKFEIMEDEPISREQTACIIRNKLMEGKDILGTPDGLGNVFVSTVNFIPKTHKTIVEKITSLFK